MSKRPEPETELSRPAVYGANLQRFRSPIRCEQLTDGVWLLEKGELSGRLPEWLIAELKFKRVIRPLSNVVLFVRGEDSETMARRATRAVRAFWLAKAGSFSPDEICGGESLVDSGPRGVKFTLDPPDELRDWDSNLTYEFDENDVDDYRKTYHLLERFDCLSEQQWSSVHLAVNAFARCASGEDRPMQIVDAFTAIEALIGSITDTTYKIRIRTSMFLGCSVQERLGLFQLVNDYYESRSHLVHGGEPEKKKYNDHLVRSLTPEPIVCIARRLVNAFVSLAVTGSYKQFRDVKKTFDEVIFDPDALQSLRAQMGLRPFQTPISK